MEEDEQDQRKLMQTMEIQHMEDLERLKESFEEELRDKSAQCTRVDEGKNIIMREFDETKKQLEDDTVCTDTRAHVLYTTYA